MEEIEVVKFDMKLIEYLKLNKRGGKENSVFTTELIKSINNLDNDEAIRIPGDKKRASRIRQLITSHRTKLNPEKGHIKLVYKKEEKMLYIFRE